MGKIIKAKEFEACSLKRFSWPEAESHAKVDMSDDNVIHAILKKQPWDETIEEAVVRAAKELAWRAKLH